VGYVPRASLKPVTVADLIAFLQAQPQHMRVAYRLWSEAVLLEKGDIKLVDACPPRADGWIHTRRPDKPTETFLMLPGS
jgi:hypothetical protein